MIRIAKFYLTYHLEQYLSRAAADPDFTMDSCEKTKNGTGVHENKLNETLDQLNPRLYVIYR